MRENYNFDYFSINNYENGYVIKYKNFNYYLFEIKDIDYVYNTFNNTLLIPYYYRFILNNKGNMVSEYNKKKYVLLRDFTNCIFNTKLLFNCYIRRENYYFNWKYLWSNRCDYIEEHYHNIKGKYKIIDESIDYYIGLLEMSIYYIKDYDNYLCTGYLQHILFDEKNYFNPLNTKIDVKERDFSEYLKFIFFNYTYKKINIRSLILSGKNIFNFDFVVARLIYPNYYFNALDEIIISNCSSSILNDIVFRSKEYEDYKLYIFSEINSVLSIDKY